MEAMKVTSRVLELIMLPSVGQLPVALVDEGRYPYLERPEAWKASPYRDTSWFSELTRRRVTTSLGFWSIQYLMADSQLVRAPASRIAQLVWQSCSAPFFTWTWAWSSRSPAESARVALRYWSPATELPVEASRRNALS